MTDEKNGQYRLGLKHVVIIHESNTFLRDSTSICSGGKSYLSTGSTELPFAIYEQKSMSCMRHKLIASRCVVQSKHAAAEKMASCERPALLFRPKLMGYRRRRDEGKGSETLADASRTWHFPGVSSATRKLGFSQPAVTPQRTVVMQS
jgi:hypothetical protein